MHPTVQSYTNYELKFIPMRCNLPTFDKKMLMSVEHKSCVTWSIKFDPSHSWADAPDCAGGSRKKRQKIANIDYARFFYYGVLYCYCLVMKKSLHQERSSVKFYFFNKVPLPKMKLHRCYPRALVIDFFGTFLKSPHPECWLEKHLHFSVFSCIKFFLLHFCYSFSKRTFYSILWLPVL